MNKKAKSTLTKMENEEIILSEEQKKVEDNARRLAHHFKDVLPNKKWFKPIHAKREVIGESIETIELKLNLLVDLGFAAKKETETGAFRYMIILSKEDKVIYLQERADYLKKELTQALSEIKKLTS